MWVRIFLENYTKLSLDAHTTFKSNWYLFPVLISRLEMQLFAHKIDLKFPSRSTHGPTSPSDFYSKTTESCAYSLIPPSNHTEFCLFWSFWLEIYSHYVRKCIWKFEVSHIFEKSRWRTSSFFLVLHNHIPVKSLAFSFSEFFSARLWRIFENVMSLQWGNPSKIGDTPDFVMILCRNIRYDTLNE